MTFHRYFFVFFVTGSVVSCSPWRESSLQEVEQKSEASAYIVVLKKNKILEAGRAAGLTNSDPQIVHTMATNLATRHSLTLNRVFSVALKAGVYEMTEEQARKLQEDSDVAYVEKDQMVQVQAVQSNVTWGLDRMDQASLPLNLTYSYPQYSTVVHAYVIDTGILSTHVEFGGRARSGIDLVDKDNDATDCNGHGTHVAGTIGSQTYGVAKSVRLHGVRVLDCAGSGSYSGVIAGIEWVTAHHIKPAVANMSLGGPISRAMDDAIAASIQAGVTYVVAAGNESTLACNRSPARLPQAITVGSVTRQDLRSSFSNYGSCVDLFAPGSDILSTWYSYTTATRLQSGTSMASPHVAGGVALYLAKYPTATPAQVATALKNGAISGKLDYIGTGSPNLLVNTQFISNGSGSGTTPADAVIKLTNNGVVSGLAAAPPKQKFFVLEVPAGATNLIFDVYGGSGDVDLYVKYGSKPTLSSYDCRPYRGGNAESCWRATPQAGKWYVMLNPYTAYSGVSLKGSYR